MISINFSLVYWFLDTFCLISEINCLLFADGLILLGFCEGKITGPKRSIYPDSTIFLYLFFLDLDASSYPDPSFLS
jgi:hypothetical protein